MMVRTIIVLLAGLLAGAASLAATPPVVVEPRDDALGLGRAAASSAVTAQSTVTAPPPAKAERVPSGNPLWAIPLRQLSATRERPLFAPSRRPPPPVVPYQLASAPPPPPPKPADPEKPRLSLVGTVAGGAEGIGVFVDSATRSVLRLKMGEVHDGWVLRGIRRREVTLEKGRQIVTLSLPTTDLSRPAAPVSPGLAAPVGGAPQGAGPLPTAPPVPANMAAPQRPPSGGIPGFVSAAGSPVPPPLSNPLPLPPGVQPPVPGFNPFKKP